MSGKKKSSASTLLKVSKIRERERKLALAKVQAERRVAEDALNDAEAQKAEEHAHIREQATGGSVSAAALSLMSEAVAAGRARVSKAEEGVAALEEPLADARRALVTSRTNRRVVEKVVDRRRTRDLKERADKIQRASDELASNRSSSHRSGE